MSDIILRAASTGPITLRGSKGSSIVLRNGSSAALRLTTGAGLRGPEGPQGQPGPVGPKGDQGPPGTGGGDLSEVQAALDLKSDLASPIFTGTVTAAKLAVNGLVNFASGAKVDEFGQATFASVGAQLIVLTNNSGFLYYYNDVNFININNGSHPLSIKASGNVGIGATSPTANLHLGAGQAAPGEAPLKLSAGTNLTTPESGALEYDGSHLYFTAGTARHQLDEQAADKSFSQAFIGSSVTVTHNFGKYPAVTVLTSAGDEIEGEVEHLSVNQLQVSFASSFSGVVNCN